MVNILVGINTIFLDEEITKYLLNHEKLVLIMNSSTQDLLKAHLRGSYSKLIDAAGGAVMMYRGCYIAICEQLKDGEIEVR